MAVTDTGLDVQQINHLWQRDGIPKKGGSFVNTTETQKKQITDNDVEMTGKCSYCSQGDYNSCNNVSIENCHRPVEIDYNGYWILSGLS